MNINDIESVYSKETLLTALDEVQQEVGTFFTELSVDAFHQRPSAEAWSYAENLEHLIRSVKPIVTALRLPKATLRLMFGTPKQASRSYQEIKDSYLGELAKGAQASGQFLPKAAKSSDSKAAQTKLVVNWKDISEKLLNVIKTWDDSALDNYLLPHPILGLLTIREMLFFTIYHDIRHISPGGD